MQVKVNGKEEFIDENISLLDFLKLKNINPALVVVELNYELPRKESWQDIILNEADNIEVIKFIGGG
jgi:thiamine biosynthesis protein ThiS